MLSKGMFVGLFASVLSLAVITSLGCHRKAEVRPGAKCAAPATSPAAQAVTALPATRAAKAVPATQAAKAAPAKWTLAFTDDFNEAKLPADWQVLEGSAEVSNGCLLFKGESEEQAQIILKRPAFPGSVRVEMTASISGEALSDLSVFFNAGSTGYESGYMVQFGGTGNTENRLRRSGEIAEATIIKQPQLVANKVYNLVVENDAGMIRFLVDNKEVFHWKDASHLKGSGHDLIGLFTWGCTVKVDKIMIYTKPEAGK